MRAFPSWQRALGVLVVAWLGLSYLCGPSLFAPSATDHYARLARSWLAGRLDLDPLPPRRLDDIARVYTYRAADGRLIRGIPCRLASCEASDAETGGLTVWSIADHRYETLPPDAVTRRKPRPSATTAYVTFPPGPAALVLPFVWLFGRPVWDIFWTVLIAGLIPALWVRWLDRERPEAPRSEHLWLAVAWTFGSPACFVGSHGNVWFTAQILAALFSSLYLFLAWRARAPVWAGVWLAWAVACRPHLLLLALVWLASWWRERESRSRLELVAFAVPVAVALAGMGVLNVLRFDDPLEFGHRYLDVVWQRRIQTYGMFSWHYFPRNVQCLLVLVPQVSSVAPFVRWSVHGMSLPLSSPWLLALFVGRTSYPQRASVLVAAGAITLVNLLYQNSGQVQFSYRFAIDVLPLVMAQLAFGGGSSRRGFAWLVVLGVVVQGYGAYFYGRAPGRLFVPSLWPFEGE